MQTVHPLADWLAANGTKQVQFAGEVGVSESFLSLIISGQRRPSPQVAAKIERLTKIDARLLLGIPIQDAAE